MPFLPPAFSADPKRGLFRWIALPLLAVLTACAPTKADPPRATPTQTASVGSEPAIVQPGAPGAPSRVLPSSTRGLPPVQSPDDTAFMQGMIMHHSQAVEMTALIPSHSQNKQIRALGARISSSQSDEMRLMQRWLAARGEPTAMPMGGGMALMPGMLTAAQMDALRQARGAQFDHLFLAGMIQHHGGALNMVHTLFNSPGAGQDADLFNFATDADNTQRAEIRIMQSLLEAK